MIVQRLFTCIFLLSSVCAVSAAQQDKPKDRPRMNSQLDAARRQANEARRQASALLQGLNDAGNYNAELRRENQWFRNENTRLKNVVAALHEEKRTVFDDLITSKLRVQQLESNEAFLLAQLAQVNAEKDWLRGALVQQKHEITRIKDFQANQIDELHYQNQQLLSQIAALKTQDPGLHTKVKH